MTFLKHLYSLRYFLKTSATSYGSCPNTPQPKAPKISVSTLYSAAISNKKCILSSNTLEFSSLVTFAYF